MDGLGSYVLSVTAASILCAIMNALVSKSGNAGGLMKLVSGVIMALVAVSPLIRISSLNFNGFLNQLNADAAAAVAMGEESANNAIRERITSSCAAYILDKAAVYDLDIEVLLKLDEVTLAPCYVEIKGNVSPYARDKLSGIISEDLGIPPEAQIWN